MFDAGEVFGIMRVEPEGEEETSNPGREDSYQVIITRESGLQASDPNR